MLNERGPTDSSQLVSVVAENVRYLRGKRSMSLGELAKQAGVGKSTLSLLESGNANPSIETLWAIGRALGVTFAELVQPREPDVRVVRAGEGVEIAAADANFVGRLLLSSARRGCFELYILEAEPGGVHEAEAHIGGSIEHLLVMEGRMRVGPTDAMVELEPGELASFAGDVAHGYEALDERARALLVMHYA